MTDVHDITPEDAFGIAPHERRDLDAAHQKLAAMRQRFGAACQTADQLFRQQSYDRLCAASSPADLAHLSVIFIQGYACELGVGELVLWERPELLIDGRDLERALMMVELSEQDRTWDHDLRILSKDAGRLCGGQWQELWIRMQNQVAVDLQLQRIAIASAE